MRYEGELNQAEALMEEHPDSALAILNSVRPSSIASIENEEERARFALLYSQALDKNYIDLASDSIISIAVDYYCKNNDNYDRYAMMSYYYLARVQYNAENYAACVVSNLEAEKIAKTINDDFFLGLIYRSISDTYNKVYCKLEDIKYAQLSFTHFKRSGNLRFAGYALTELGRAYNNNRQYDKAIECYRQAITDANKNEQLDIVNFAYDRYAHTLWCMDSIEHAKQILLYLKDINMCHLTVVQSAHLSDIYTSENILDSAWHYINESHNNMQTVIDSAAVLDAKYNYFKALNMPDSAMAYLLRLDKFQNRITDTSLRRAVLSAQSDYYNHAAQTAEIKAENNRLVSIIVVCISGIILVVIISIWIIYSNHKKRQLTEMLQNAQTMVDSLNAEQEKTFTILNSHIQAISNLCNTYYELSESKHEINLIKKQLYNEITNISNNTDIYNQIKKAIDHKYPNLISGLTVEMTELSQLDIMTIYYLISGMPLGAICILTNSKNGTLRTRKSRIKEKIRISSFSQKEFLLSLLS